MNAEKLQNFIEPLSSEPWVRLANGKELADWGKEDEILYNQVNRQTEKYLFYRRAFDYLSGTNISGDYHEYGCHRCRTFRMALTEARLHNWGGAFFAFDSFQGLPAPESKTDVEGWEQAMLATSESDFMKMVEEHGIYNDRVRSIKGFYQESLTDELQRHFIEDENKIAIVTVDCDLYESAAPVFEFIEPLLQEGAVIYIDDLFAGYKGSPLKGVSRAFLEFQRNSQWKFIHHLNIGWWGRSYIAYLGEENLSVQSLL